MIDKNSVVYKMIMVELSKLGPIVPRTFCEYMDERYDLVNFDYVNYSLPELIDMGVIQITKDWKIEVVNEYRQ